MKTTEIDKLHEQVQAEFAGYFERKEELEEQIHNLREKVENADGEIKEHEEKGMFEKVTDVLRFRSSNEQKLRDTVEELEEVKEMIQRKKDQRSPQIMNQIRRVFDADHETNKAGRPDQIRQEVAEKMAEVQELVAEHTALSKEWSKTEVSKRNQFNKYLNRNESNANRTAVHGFYQDFTKQGVSEGMVEASKRKG